ncbi:hypothetical protein SCP_0510610 [Sparassis crispa]|uniref:Uncharacterized protein n=1 Tax=Sparassis crispa TaxID=139825 RepID=A0A401GP69_9APHY|nr:hypothetical protein SCP_0510610 [Sparassis crispa]GBE84002.1 hypothetical protein SCP_0510610 [Sparassis crispa]
MGIGFVEAEMSKGIVCQAEKCFTNISNTWNYKSLTDIEKSVNDGPTSSVATIKFTIEEQACGGVGTGSAHEIMKQA